MIKLLLKILIYTNFINITKCKIINIETNSILTFNYFNINKNPSSIKLNNRLFRESSLLPKNKGIFSIGIKPGRYNINTNDITYNLTIENGKILKSNSKLKTKLLKKNKITILEKINYYHNKEHNLKLSSMINLKKLHDIKSKYKIEILIDNNIILSDIYHKNVFSYLSNILKMSEGNHTIILRGNSIDNTWCSCLEANNGFNFGRHLTAWILKPKDETKKILNDINKKLQIKNNIVKYNNQTCKNKIKTKNIKQNNIYLLEEKINFDFKKLFVIQY